MSQGKSPHWAGWGGLERQGFKSQKQLINYAAKQGIEISARRYGSIERGQGRPTLEEVVQICRVLGISADAWLFGDDSGVVLREMRANERHVVAVMVRALTGMRQ